MVGLIQLQVPILQRPSVENGGEKDSDSKQQNGLLMETGVCAYMLYQQDNEDEELMIEFPICSLFQHPSAVQTGDRLRHHPQTTRLSHVVDVG